MYEAPQNRILGKRQEIEKLMSPSSSVTKKARELLLKYVKKCWYLDKQVLQFKPVTGDRESVKTIEHTKESHSSTVDNSV